jgi:hypothetical protein
MVRVLSSIHLDDEPRTFAHEIRDEASDGHLPAKLPTLEALGAQAIPQLLLGIRHLRAQVSRIACRPWLAEGREVRDAGH